MTPSQIVDSLGRLSKKWLKPGFRYRKLAVSRLVSASGFSEKMAGAICDALFSELTAPRLRALLKAELGDARVLERFVRDRASRRLVRAKAPETVIHVFSANVPGAAVSSLVMGLLIGSRNVCRLSRRDRGMLEIYLRSLKEHDRRLWKRCKIVRGGRPGLGAWTSQAGLVVAYGRDETLVEIRRALPAKTLFVGYGHRVSFALVLHAALSRAQARRIARQSAYDVWMADRRGCLSPAVIFAQKGGRVSPVEFAGLLAGELGRLEKGERTRPRRAISDWISMRALRDQCRIDLSRGGRARIWQSPSGSWMVGYDERPSIELLADCQIIRVNGFKNLKELEPGLARMKRVTQAVSLECGRQEREKTAEWLASLGVNRICRAGKLQKPPITWHHDGGLNLANWLTWIDLED